MGAQSSIAFAFPRLNIADLIEARLHLSEPPHNRLFPRLNIADLIEAPPSLPPVYTAPQFPRLNIADLIEALRLALDHPRAAGNFRDSTSRTSLKHGQFVYFNEVVESIFPRLNIADLIEAYQHNGGIVSGCISHFRDSTSRTSLKRRAKIQPFPSGDGFPRLNIADLIEAPCCAS